MSQHKCFSQYFVQALLVGETSDDGKIHFKEHACNAQVNISHFHHIFHMKESKSMFELQRHLFEKPSKHADSFPHLFEMPSEHTGSFGLQDLGDFFSELERTEIRPTTLIEDSHGRPCRDDSPGFAIPLLPRKSIPTTPPESHRYESASEASSTINTPSMSSRAGSHRMLKVRQETQMKKMGRGGTRVQTHNEQDRQTGVRWVLLQKNKQLSSELSGTSTPVSVHQRLSDSPCVNSSRINLSAASLAAASLNANMSPVIREMKLKPLLK